MGRVWGYFCEYLQHLPANHESADVWIVRGEVGEGGSHESLLLEGALRCGVVGGCRTPYVVGDGVEEVDSQTEVEVANRVRKVEVGGVDLDGRVAVTDHKAVDLAFHVVVGDLGEVVLRVVGTGLDARVGVEQAEDEFVE